MIYNGPLPGEKIEVEVVGVFRDCKEFNVVIEHPLLGRGTFVVKMKALEEYDDTE